MSRVSIDMSVKITGPVFDKGLQRDLVKGVNEGLQDIASLTERNVKLQLFPGHGFVTGNLREAVAGDLVRDLTAVVDAGEHIQGRDVPYAAVIEAGRRGTSFRGYHMFRNGAAFARALPLAGMIGARIMRFLK